MPFKPQFSKSQAGRAQARGTKTLAPRLLLPALSGSKRGLRQIESRTSVLRQRVEVDPPYMQAYSRGACG